MKQKNTQNDGDKETMLSGLKSLLPNTREGKEKKIRMNEAEIKYYQQHIDRLELENDELTKELEKMP